MKVPISAIVSNDTILINRNGQTIRVPLPFKPFMMLDAEKFKDVKSDVTEKWTKVPENITKDYIRLQTSNIDSLKIYQKRFNDRSRYLLANPYLEQVFISKPEFFLDYPHTDSIRIMFYDIEVSTKGDGFFPKPINNEILCIGYSIWDYLNDGSKVKIKHEICKGFNENTLDEEVLNGFINAVEEYDPDIIADYFGSDFDMPYIGERCEILGLDTSRLSRGTRKPSLDKNKIYIPGRIHFDIFNSNSGVIKDQTLFDIKNRSLKTLARWYKIKKAVVDVPEEKWEDIDDIELPGEIENLQKLFKENPDRLYAYQDDDVFRTEGVGDVYIRNCITLAEMLGVPLNSIMNMYSSFVPKISVARNYEKEKLINTETNFQRYNLENGSIAKVSNKYEGAIVGLYKDGYFENTWKLDFASQYPSAAQTFNLGPDTTQLMEVRPYKELEYKCHKDSKWTWYEIPTKFEKGKYSYNFVIRVRNDKDGFLKKDIAKLRKERSSIKKEMFSMEGNQKKIKNSQQNAIKIIINSLYGLMGLKTSIYGEMITACMITAMCRWSILKCMQRNEKYLIETDSVTKDTPIYVKDNNNNIDIIPIEDLHNSEDKRSIYNGFYKVLTRNGWSKINYTKKHKVCKDIHRIKISDGYVDVTEDHSLFDINKLEISPKEIKESVSKIETISELCINENVYDQVIDLEWCWFIGFLIAEGTVYEGYNKNGIAKRQVSLNGNDINLMLKIEKLANKFFNNDTFNSKFKTDNTISSSSVYKVQGGYNKKICDYLKDMCYTKNRKDKKVPKFILNGTSKMKESFLDGLMCGDGYKKVINNRKIESLDSKFKSLAAGVRYLWKNLGFKTCCNIRDDKTNITTYKKRHPYKNGTFKNIDLNLVTKNKIIEYDDYVYDICTDDGTFVTALGDIVLHNTDGIVVDKELNADEENKWLEKELIKKFNIDENYMELELEGDGERAWFYAMKSYVVEHSHGNYTIHGSPMKSSKMSHVVDRAIKLGIDHVFYGKSEEDAIREAYDFRNCTLEDFTERVNLSKEQHEYDDQTDFRIYLAKQVEMKTGQVITKGTQMSYIVTKSVLPYKEFKIFQKSGKNYTFVKLVDDIDDVDYTYYAECIDKALAKFGIKRNKQLSLFDDGITKPYRSKKLDKVPKKEL